jgi:hypothetical protein
MHTRRFSGYIGVEVTHGADRCYEVNVYLVRELVSGAKTVPVASPLIVKEAELRPYLESLGFCKFEAWQVVKDANPAYDAPRPSGGLLDPALVRGGMQTRGR